MGTAIQYSDHPYTFEQTTLPPVLSGEQVCRLLGYRKSRFYKLVALGCIPEDLRAPLPRGWSRDKVLAWLAKAPPPVRTRGGGKPPVKPPQAKGRKAKTGAATAAKR